MNQIAFTIGSKPIHWYGVCIAVGFLLATGLMLWKRSYAKMTKDQIFDITYSLTRYFDRADCSSASNAP